MKGMMGEREYLFVCIPLTLGVFLAATLSTHILHSPDAGFLAAGVSFAMTAGGLALASSRKSMRESVPLWCFIFFFCGVSCLLENNLPASGSVGVRLTQLLEPVQAGVGGMMDSIPFRDRRDTALAKALLTGNRDGLSASMKTAFRNAGAAHMLALSGMHLGIIYIIINRLLTIVGNSMGARRVKSMLTIAATGLYTVLCSASPSLLRAWLFIVLYESGKFFGRPQKAERVLCTVLTIHLVFRPSDISEIGFQLSYLAMVGIVFLWPHMRNWYNAAGAGKRIWDITALSLSCQLFTGPLAYMHFHFFPKFFLLTNLLGAPLLTIVMLCSISAFTMSALGIPDCLIYTWLEAPVSLLRIFMETMAGLEN